MDKRQTDRLVSENYGFAISLARQYSGQGLMLDDLVSEATVGLVKAAQLYDPSKGQAFVQYAVWHIRHAIEKALSQEKRQTGRQVLKETRVNRSASDSVSDKTALDNSQLEDIANGMHILNEREQKVIGAFYGIDQPELTMAEIAEEMGLKRERVRQIRKTAERHLRKVRTKQ